MPLVVFTLDEQRYALPYTAISGIVPLVEITPLPNSPEEILGVINVQGEFVPIIDIRVRLKLSNGILNMQDLIIIANPEQPIGFIVNNAHFMEFSEYKLFSNPTIIKDFSFIEKIIKDAKGPLHVLNIRKLVPQYLEPLLAEILEQSNFKQNSTPQKKREL